MPKSHLPRVMRGVSASQLVADATLQGGRRTIDADSNQLGNSVQYTLTNPFPPGTTTNNEVPEKRLVRATATDLYSDGRQFDGLSWILTGQVTEFNGVFSGNQNLDFLRLRILFGSGGNMCTATVTAGPFFALTVPGNTIDVSVFAPPVFPAVEPGSFQVSGNLTRASSVYGSEGRLLTYTTDATADRTINIPAFARRVQTLGSDVDDVYDASSLLAFESGDVSAVLTYSGPELLALKKSGTKIEIPAGCFAVAQIGDIARKLPPLSWDIVL